MIRDTVTHSTATAGVRHTRGTRTDELPAWELSLTSASVHHITVGDWWWLWHWNVQGKLVPLKLIRMGVHSNALSSVTKWALLLVILQTGPGNAAGTQSQVIKVIIRSWKYLYKMRTNRFSEMWFIEPCSELSVALWTPATWAFISPLRNLIHTCEAIHHW